MKKIRVDKRDITFFLTGAALTVLIGMIYKLLTREKKSGN